MTPEEAIRRSHQAQRLLDDPLLKEALDIMAREVHEAWLAVPIRDVEGREACYRLAVTTRKFTDLLRGTMEAGKLAKEQIKQKEESMAQRAKNSLRSMAGIGPSGSRGY